MTGSTFESPGFESVCLFCVRANCWLILYIGRFQAVSELSGHSAGSRSQQDSSHGYSTPSIIYVTTDLWWETYFFHQLSKTCSGAQAQNKTETPNLPNKNARRSQCDPRCKALHVGPGRPWRSRMAWGGLSPTRCTLSQHIPRPQALLFDTQIVCVRSPGVSGGGWFAVSAFGRKSASEPKNRTTNTDLTGCVRSRGVPGPPPETETANRPLREHPAT